MLSIVTPAFNEAGNLEALHGLIVETMTRLGDSWEWVIVDDQSHDATFQVIERMAVADPRVRGIRLARRSGSHAAIACGLRHARGAAAITMAADLQDPPETLGRMCEHWRSGAQVVWAARRQAPGRGAHALSAALFYWFMRRVLGMTALPARGADYFLVDRVVLDALQHFRERNVSVLALIVSMGFRQEQIEYDKRPRAAGRSGWTLPRKIALALDSVLGFSAAPIRLCSYLGTALIAAGLAVLVYAAIPPRAGIALVLGVVIVLTGLQLMALGLVGEYVWRALDEARGRPAYLIEAVAGAGAAPIDAEATGRRAAALQPVAANRGGR
jgi:glycosyltransferase involved in cell wall biosynthesis